MAGKKKSAAAGTARAAAKSVKKKAKSAKPTDTAETPAPAAARGRNSVDPGKWLDFFNKYRKAKGEHQGDVDVASTSGSKVQEVCKKAKAQGIDPDVIIEVYKLLKVDRDDLAKWFADMNMLMVLVGLAVPVKRVSGKVIDFGNQLGLFPDGKSVAEVVDSHATNDGDGEGRFTQQQIDSAKARGTKAGEDGWPADKNPFDLNNPLYDAWEGSRQDRVKAIAEKAYGGGAQGMSH